MIAASSEAAEERIATLLDGLTLTPTNITGDTDVATVQEFTAMLAALQYERGGNRYSSLALAQDMYTGLINAVDADGRKLLPVLGATNADGTVRSDFGRVLIGNATGVPAWGLSDYSYLIVPTSVYQWLSPVQRLTFDIQVKSIYIGLFQYSAEACIRDSDVKRLTYAA
jgi:hypothetical protein